MVLRSARQRICDYFEGQHGVIARWQALECGLTRRAIEIRLSRGEWSSLMPGIYRLEGTPHTWKQRVMAAILWAHREAVASHLTAAALHGFPGCGEGPIEIIAACNMKSARVLAHRHRLTSRLETCRIDGIPTTSATRTLADVCARVSPRMLDRSVDYALIEGLTSLDALWRQLNRMGTRGRKGTPELRTKILERMGKGKAESVSESDLHALLRRRGIEGWRAQVEIRDGDERVARPDIVFESEKVIVEMMSFKWHSSKEQRHRDARRQNALERLGWTVLQFFWEDLLFDPDYIVEQIRLTLSGRRAHPRETGHR